MIPPASAAACAQQPALPVSAPRKLCIPRGPELHLKICEGYFVLYLLFAFGYAALCPPAEFTYDLSLARAVLIAAFSCRSLWLMHIRRKAARPWSLMTLALCVSLSAFDLFGLGAMSDAAVVVGLPVAAVVTALEYVGAVYVGYQLLRNEGLAELLCKERDTTPAYEGGHSWDQPLSVRVRTWEFWRDLLSYFVVFSFLGHWAEMLFCRLIVAGVFMGDYDPTNAMLWDQWLFPFTAEGAALAAVVVCLHPIALRLQKRFGAHTLRALALSFLANGIVCTGIDFATGMLANQHYEFWDYRRLPFNFMGQICLQNSLVYTVAATIVVWLAYPAMDSFIRRLPRATANGLFCALAGSYVFLALLHFVDPSLMVA